MKDPVATLMNVIIKTEIACIASVQKGMEERVSWLSLPLPSQMPATHAQARPKKIENNIEIVKENEEICCSLLFISGNLYFSFVSPLLAHIYIPKNKRKTKIT